LISEKQSIDDKLLRLIDEKFVKKLSLHNELCLWIQQKRIALMCSIPVFACAIFLCAVAYFITDWTSFIALISAYIAWIGPAIVLIKEFMDSSGYTELLVQYNYKELETEVKTMFSDDKLVLFRALVILKSKQP
jgi:hypothetical protein